MNKFIFSFILLLISNHICFAENILTTKDILDMNITVYSSGFGLVKDIRNVNLEKGLNSLSFSNVSAQIQPETSILRGGNLKVLEQNFNYDLISKNSLLEKFTNKEVTVIKTNLATGTETEEKAVILSTSNGTILKIGNRIETDYPGRFIFSNIPENLKEKPTLTIDVFSEKKEQTPLELSYLTQGLSWEANYVAKLNDEENLLSLNGWVTMTNNSGVDYTDANVQFVAGNVNRVQNFPKHMRLKKANFAETRVSMDSTMIEENLMDYHLYSLERKTSILSNQTKQLSLFTAQKIPTIKEYSFKNILPSYVNKQNNFQKDNAIINIIIDNSKQSNLGIPLPAGTVRVYKDDNKKRVFFVGEDVISHTSENEKIKLSIGQAFDITATKKQTSFLKLGDITEAEYEIIFKNAKETTEQIIFSQFFSNNDFKILNSNISYQENSASEYTWNIKIPAKQSTILRFKIQMRK
ncbi:MAG: DUF4139 domain-containing protein [Alphaproteobacteria bacterium]|nr:DUF4139 domain-containing protein [Alphaproteobacteria bacterium]